MSAASFWPNSPSVRLPFGYFPTRALYFWPNSPPVRLPFGRIVSIEYFSSPRDKILSKYALSPPFWAWFVSIQKKRLPRDRFSRNLVPGEHIFSYRYNSRIFVPKIRLFSLILSLRQIFFCIEKIPLLRRSSHRSRPNPKQRSSPPQARSRIYSTSQA